MWCDSWSRTSIAEDRVVGISSLQLVGTPQCSSVPFRHLGKKRWFEFFGPEMLQDIKLI